MSDRLTASGLRRRETIQCAAAAAGVAAFYILLQACGITCPILFLTGVSCAGCGMTRAWLSVLSGDLVTAFHFHPLFWTLPLVGVGWLLRRRLPRRLLSVLFWTAVVLFMAVYILRMLNPEDTVVRFAPEEGLFLRTLRLLRSI